ncbi:hypothetical protein Scep_024185 [Stephania cephalantha]|uniref:Uncharacterized protein n=1 Tax=Stephania cephalantha TaxID=152367 RepID=A0AAP0HY77_9MAGN
MGGANAPPPPPLLGQEAQESMGGVWGPPLRGPSSLSGNGRLPPPFFGEGGDPTAAHLRRHRDGAPPFWGVDITRLRRLQIRIVWSGTPHTLTTELTAASALAGDRTRDAGGGRQPEVLTLSPEKALGGATAGPPDRNVSGTPPKLVCGSHNPKSGQKQFYRCKGIDISCDVYVGGSPETTIAGSYGRTTIIKVYGSYRRFEKFVFLIRDDDDGSTGRATIAHIGTRYAGADDVLTLSPEKALMAAPPPDHRDRNVSGTPPKLVCGSHNPKSGQKQFYRCKGIDISCDVYVGGSPGNHHRRRSYRSNHDH